MLRAEALTRVDIALDHSFPASDPPAWNSGCAEAAPPRSPHIVLEPISVERQAWTQVAGSAVMLVGLVLLAPLAIVALPAALAWRAVLAVTRWRG